MVSGAEEPETKCRHIFREVLSDGESVKVETCCNLSVREVMDSRNVRIFVPQAAELKAVNDPDGKVERTCRQLLRLSCMQTLYHLDHLNERASWLRRSTPPGSRAHLDALSDIEGILDCIRRFQTDLYRKTTS